MNKILILIVSVLGIAIVLSVILPLLLCIGCGTAFEYRPTEGCELLENKTYEELAATDEILDGIKMKYGFGSSGYNTGTLREFCEYRLSEYTTPEGCISEYGRHIIRCCESPDSCKLYGE